MTKSVALVSAVDPYPTDAGKKVVLAGFVEYLSVRLGARNVHYLMVEKSTLHNFPVALHPLPKPTPGAALTRVLTRTATAGSSLQESLLGTPDLRDAIHRTLDAIAPDIEIYDTVRMGQHARPEGRRQICYLDDLFSERYRSMLQASARYPGVEFQALGNFATHVPKRVRMIAESPRAQRQLLRLEQRLIRKSEDRAASQFDMTLLINEQEAELLRRRCDVGAGRIESLPPLIGHRSPRPRSFAGAPDFVFLGLLSLPHNDDGLRSFLTDVWPRVLAARPRARLRVVGREPRRLLSALVAQYSDSVTLEGFIPDLNEVLADTAAMINPLRFGSGIKLKVIEALSAGVPIVSTAVGAHGVAAGTDQGVLVADDAAEFADLMIGLTDCRYNATLSQAASSHFAEHYSYDAVFARYDTVFGLG